MIQRFIEITNLRFLFPDHDWRFENGAPRGLSAAGDKGDWAHQLRSYDEPLLFLRHAAPIPVHVTGRGWLTDMPKTL